MFLHNVRIWREVRMEDVSVSYATGPRSDKEIIDFLLGKLNRAGRNLASANRKLAARRRICERVELDNSRLRSRVDRLLRFMRSRRIKTKKPPMLRDAIGGALLGMFVGSLRRGEVQLPDLVAGAAGGAVLGSLKVRRKKAKRKPRKGRGNVDKN